MFLKFQNLKIALWKIGEFKPHKFMKKSYVPLCMDCNINNTMNLILVVFQFKDLLLIAQI